MFVNRANELEAINKIIERIRTCVYVRGDLIRKAKDRRLNMSKIAEDALREILGQSDARPSTHTHAEPTDPAYGCNKGANAPKSPSKRNMEKVMCTLMEKGLTPEGSFSSALLRRVLQLEVGSDPRTVKRYMRLLHEHRFVEQADGGFLRMVEVSDLEPLADFRPRNLNRSEQEESLALRHMCHQHF